MNKKPVIIVCVIVIFTLGLISFGVYLFYREYRNVQCRREAEEQRSAEEQKRAQQRLIEVRRKTEELKALLETVEVSGVLGELAIVNGETVKEGDEIAGVKVEEISDEYVKFRLGDEVFAKKVGKAVDRQEQAGARPDLEVNGVFGKLAIVNGETVKEGDEIAGVKVEEISDKYVKFSFKDKVFSIKVGSSREPLGNK